MATLFKKPGSPYYWLRFSHNGKRYQESTKKRFNQHNAAQKVADDREAEVKGSGSYSDLFTRTVAAINALPEKDQANIRRELAQKLLAGSDRKLLIEDAIELFRIRESKNISDKQIRNYLNVWSKFTEWLDDEKTKDAAEYMHEVGHLTALHFFDHLGTKNLTGRTTNVYRTQLRRIFETLTHDAGLMSNPFDNIKPSKERSHGKENLTLEQVNEIQLKATGEMRTLIMVGFYTGLRLSDAVLLKAEQVNLDSGFITLTVRKTKHVKKGQLKLGIAPILAMELANVPQKGYIMPKLAAEHIKCTAAVAALVRDLFIDAGIKTREEREDGHGRAACVYGFHSLRHSLITILAQKGVPQATVMAMVGHSSEAVHHIYQHTNDTDLLNAAALMPDITTEAKSC